MCLWLSDLSSEDNPHLLLLFNNSVRGVHAATECGDSDMLAFAIYSLLTHTARTTLFLSQSLTSSFGERASYTTLTFHLYLPVEILQGELRKNGRGGRGGTY